MERLYRVVDANINRASEGLRVLEDMARFYHEDKTLSRELKKLRHNIRKQVMEFSYQLMDKRDSSFDIGLSSSKEMLLDNKSSIREVLSANFKRVQEALRVVEENLKVLGMYKISKDFEDYRFKTYSIEKEYLLHIARINKGCKIGKGLYCITAQEYSNGKDNIEVVRAMIDAGVKIIQYREKDKKLREKYRECEKIREITRSEGVTFIVNDDIDIAQIVDADGVHVGQDDLPIEKVRQLLGENKLIGVSTHCPEQAQDAVRRGADYIGVGPLYKTYTKKDVCDPVGLEYLDYVAKNIKIPFVAIGGIKEKNLEEVLTHGAECVAMVTEIVGDNDIKSKIERILNKIKR